MLLFCCLVLCDPLKCGPLPSTPLKLLCQCDQCPSMSVLASLECSAMFNGIKTPGLLAPFLISWTNSLLPSWPLHLFPQSLFFSYLTTCHRPYVLPLKKLICLPVKRCNGGKGAWNGDWLERGWKLSFPRLPLLL